MQCSTCECPKASRTKHSTLYLVLTTMVTLVAFLAAAANRKDLRISTNSSLKSLSPHCNCQLWIQFHAITVWLFPATQTFNHTYDHLEASWMSWKSLASVSLPEDHTAPLKNVEITVSISYTTTQGKCWVGLTSTHNPLGGEQGESCHLPGFSPEQWPLSPSLSSYPLAFRF